MWIMDGVLYKVLTWVMILAVLSLIVEATPSLAIINQSYAFIDENNTFVSASSPKSDKLSNITIISNSNSVYSIPSTFVQVDKFNIQYTIYGRAHSFNNSKNLITSTIVDDYDKNPNIGYVINGSGQTLNTSSQPGLANPFMSKDSINQKIRNEVQEAIAGISASNPAEKYAEIKCTFGMVLVNYNCS
jgi:hypothetical protein